jgi:hypothetical protein
MNAINSTTNSGDVMNSLTPALRMSIRELSVQAYTNGFTRWYYRCAPVNGMAHRLRDTMGAGYFNDAADMMREGDMIDVSARDGGATLYVVATKHQPDLVRVVAMARTPEFSEPPAVVRKIATAVPASQSDVVL